MKKLFFAAVASILAVSSFIAPKEVLNKVNEHMVSVAQATGVEKTEGDYRYVIRDNGTVKITRYIGRDRKVEIPRKIADKKVTIIGAEAFEDSNCTKITISKDVTIIGVRAFADSESLKTVILPDGIKKIEDEAFADCDRLNNVKLPKQLEVLKRTVFDDCSRLKSVTVPENIKLESLSLGYDDDEKIRGFEIKCYGGSSAQKYAEDNNLNYTIIGEGTASSPTPEAVENTPVPTAESTIAPEPTVYDDDAYDDDNDKYDDDYFDDDDEQNANTVAIVIVIITAIVAIAACIIIVTRRKK